MILGVILYIFSPYMERCGLGRWRREVFLPLGLFFSCGGLEGREKGKLCCFYCLFIFPAFMNCTIQNITIIKPFDPYHIFSLAASTLPRPLPARF